VLLPVSLLSRRVDLVEVIGAALVAVARGMGVRRAAGLVGRPVETVRGWVRRLAGRAEAVRELFTVLLVEVGPDPVVPAAAGGALGDAVAAVVGAGVAVAARWPVLGGVSPWRLACAVSGGLLLSAGWP